MPQRYVLLGGGIIEGDTPEEIVAQLREKSFSPGESEAEFMEQMSQRCKRWNESIISTHNYEEFVADLVENKFLIPITGSAAQPIYPMSLN